MKANKPYKDIGDSFKWLRIQILEGIPWACDNLPAFETPQQMFDWFKMRTKFHKDPPNTEMFQTLPTLMENNYWGSPGLGDCDCFSIALATAMSCANWDNYITIVSKNKRYPVHIYNEVEWDGDRYIMDLTNPYFDQERKQYKYYQTIPVNL